MPLIDINTNRTVTKHPHAGDLALVKKKAGTDRYQAMMDDLDQRVHEKEVATASWMPPREDWRNTVYAPLVEIANDDWDFSGLLFGCVVWAHFMSRPERWGFGRYNKKNGQPIGGITYFRLD
jgi:hypothetical protein